MKIVGANAIADAMGGAWHGVPGGAFKTSCGLKVPRGAETREGPRPTCVNCTRRHAPQRRGDALTHEEIADAIRRFQAAGGAIRKVGEERIETVRVALPTQHSWAGGAALDFAEVWG